MKNNSTGKAGKKVGFQFTAAPGNNVFVAGTFNNWDAGQHALRDNPDSGHYKAVLILAPGEYQYKFVVDGEWQTDPAAEVQVPNGVGSLNSVVRV